MKHIDERRGVKHFRVHGKGRKLRYVPILPWTLVAIDAYLEAGSRVSDELRPLFSMIRNDAVGKLDEAI